MESTIRDWANAFSGYAFPSEDLVSIGIPVLKIGNVQRKCVTKEVDSYYNGELSQKLERYILQKNDFLIAMTGAGSVGRVGKMFECKGIFLVNQRIAIVRPKNEDNGFLYYWMSMPFVEKYLYSLGIGAGQPNISANDILNVKLNAPTLNVQRKIASILSSYDNLIENNNKRIRLLEQMAENLYKEWFVRFRFPGHEKAEFESGLPKGWKIWSISKLCDINRKTLNSKNKGLEIEYLDTSSITCNQIVGTESYVFEEAPSRARRIVKHNSIVFSTVRPNLKHYGILKNIPDNLIVSTGFAVFDSKYDIANIIYLFLSSQEVVDYCQLIAEGAVATYPSIKPEEIGRLKIALPNIEIAEKWNGKLESLYSEILNIQKQNTLLTRQRDLLLPRLMSGKLEVKV